MGQKLILLIILLCSPVLLFAQESPVYWNLGQATFHTDFTIQDYHIGFDFESVTLNLREPVTGLGLRLKPFEGTAYEEYTILGSGLDIYWSPFTFLDYSRLGPFVSGRISYYPRIGFQLKAGLDFSISLATFLVDSGFPMVTDIVQVRIGYFSQNNSFFISISTDILLFLFFISETY